MARVTFTLALGALGAIGLVACAGSSSSGATDSDADEAVDGNEEGVDTSNDALTTASRFACGNGSCKSTQYCRAVHGGRVGAGTRYSCVTPRSCTGVLTCACTGVLPNSHHASCGTRDGHVFVTVLGM